MDVSTRHHYSFPAPSVIFSFSLRSSSIVIPFGLDGHARVGGPRLSGLSCGDLSETYMFHAILFTTATRSSYSGIAFLPCTLLCSFPIIVSTKIVTYTPPSSSPFPKLLACYIYAISINSVLCICIIHFFEARSMHL